MLHIIKTSPYTDKALENCLQRMLPHDAMLLLADGVYALTLGAKLTAALPDCGHLAVLESDANARGIDLDNYTVEKIDYAGFVALTLAHTNNISW